MPLHHSEAKYIDHIRTRRVARTGRDRAGFGVFIGYLMAFILRKDPTTYRASVSASLMRALPTRLRFNLAEVLACQMRYCWSRTNMLLELSKVVRRPYNYL